MDEPVGINDLVSALRAQTAAIYRLAASNEALVQAMADEQGIDTDDDVGVYLNGRPV